MLNEDLEKLRKKYNELREKRLEVLKIGEAIEEYKQHPAVKKYLELIKLYEENTTGIMYEFDKKTDEDLLYSAITSVRINETNNIYVYMGTYIKNHEYDIEHGSRDYRVNKNDPKADYMIYRNLELMSYQDDYEISIPIKECKRFEDEHTVIYPNRTWLNDQYYLKLRDEFFATAIREGQDKALEKIKRLK